MGTAGLPEDGEGAPARRRGRDEGGVIIIDDSDDDDAPPPPLPPAGEGSNRGARVKEEKADDGGFSAFSKFF